MNCLISIYMCKYCSVDPFHQCTVISIKNPTGTHVCLSIHAQKYVCFFSYVLIPYLNFSDIVWDKSSLYSVIFPRCQYLV